jgi:hypothetical protein
MFGQGTNPAFEFCAVDVVSGQCESLLVGSSCASEISCALQQIRVRGVERLVALRTGVVILSHQPTAPV